MTRRRTRKTKEYQTEKQIQPNGNDWMVSNFQTSLLAIVTLLPSARYIHWLCRFNRNFESANIPIPMHCQYQSICRIFIHSHCTKWSFACATRTFLLASYVYFYPCYWPIVFMCRDFYGTIDRAPSNPKKKTVRLNETHTKPKFDDVSIRASYCFMNHRLSYIVSLFNIQLWVDERTTDNKWRREREWKTKIWERNENPWTHVQTILYVCIRIVLITISQIAIARTAWQEKLIKWRT